MAKSIKLTDSTISVTYSELVQLRDLGVLYPGATYRITDYQCSSSDNDTSVASNKFDRYRQIVRTLPCIAECI